MDCSTRVGISRTHIGGFFYLANKKRPKVVIQVATTPVDVDQWISTFGRRLSSFFWTTDFFLFRRSLMDLNPNYFMILTYKPCDVVLLLITDLWETWLNSWVFKWPRPFCLIFKRVWWGTSALGLLGGTGTRQRRPPRSLVLSAGWACPRCHSRPVSCSAARTTSIDTPKLHMECMKIVTTGCMNPSTTQVRIHGFMAFVWACVFCSQRSEIYSLMSCKISRIR